MEQVIQVIDGEEEYEERGELEDTILSDPYVIFSPYNENGYVIARYDFSIFQWISEETLEPVEAEEWWPVPPIGSGITGGEDVKS